MSAWRSAPGRLPPVGAMKRPVQPIDLHRQIFRESELDHRASDRAVGLRNPSERVYGWGAEIAAQSESHDRANGDLPSECAGRRRSGRPAEANQKLYLIQNGSSEGRSIRGRPPRVAQRRRKVDTQQLRLHARSGRMERRPQCDKRIQL